MTHGDNRSESLLTGDAAQRRQAIAGLAAQGDQQAASVLTDALLHSHWPVCDELADALAQMCTDAARQGLMRALRGRRHHIRSAAVKALARLGGAGLREVIAALANDPSYEVRQDVAEAIQRLDRQGE